MGSRDKKQRKKLAQGKTAQGGHVNDYDSMADEGTLGKKERIRGKKGHNDSRAKRIKEGQNPVAPKPKAPPASISWGGSYSPPSFSSRPSIGSNPSFRKDNDFSKSYEQMYPHVTPSRTSSRSSSSLVGSLRGRDRLTDDSRRKEISRSEKDYSKAFEFSAREGGYRIRPTGEVSTNIEEIQHFGQGSKESDVETVYTSQGIYNSLNETLERLSGVSGIEQEVTAIQSLIAKKTGRESKTSRDSDEFTLTSEAREKFGFVYFDGPGEDYFLKSTNFPASEVKQVVYDGICSEDRHIILKDGTRYSSFENAEQDVVSGSQIAKDLQIAKQIIKDRNGTIF